MLALDLELPRFPMMIQEFLHDQLHSADNNPPNFDPLNAQVFMGKVSVFNSAAASFYAPSDISGTGGMRREHIQSTPSWRGGAARYDCVFVNVNADAGSSMDGLMVA